MSIPQHEYEVVSGTKPAPYVEHDPRTIEHRTIVGDDTDLNMMTEIGDGVFVAWSNCRKCNARVASCKCSGGPVEPEYIKRWRDDKRFAKELGERPEPAFELLPAILDWVRERGYTVEKVETEEPDEKVGDLATAVDAGLDNALDAVRTESVSPRFQRGVVYDLDRLTKIPDEF